MDKQSRRQFIRSSAVAVAATGVLGAGIGQRAGAAQDSSVPDYAEWIPEGEIILNQQGEIDIRTYTLDAQVKLFAEVSTRGDPLLQLEPFIYTSRMTGLWQILAQVDLAEVVFGSLVGAERAEDVEPSGIPADRHTLLGRTSVYAGSFDTDAIAESVRNSDAEETEFAGVYEYPNDAVIAWGDGYLIQGDNQNIEQVAAIRNTGDGDQQPRYENTAELEQLLTAVDHSGQTFLRLTEDGTLNTSQYSDTIDHSPIEGASGYIGTLGYDVDTAEFDATTVIRYPDEGSIDRERISGMVTNALSQEITAEGRSVRVTARYDRDEVGYNPDANSDTDSETDGGGTDGNETQEMDDSDTNTSEDGSESSDGSGPGFGVLSAATGLGGAGYLLSKRLGEDSE